MYINICILGRMSFIERLILYIDIKNESKKGLLQDHVILILTRRQSLTKAVFASESFWNLGTPRLHLMRTITLAHSQDNIAFLSTNILNVIIP